MEQVAITPSSALFSTRDKPDQKYCEEIFKVFRAHDVRYFFYIGGNDSADTVRIVNEQAELSDYEFRAIHIPKTIDNDLVVNDHTPGYGSAARYVAQCDGWRQSGQPGSYRASISAWSWAAMPAS